LTFAGHRRPSATTSKPDSWTQYAEWYVRVASHSQTHKQLRPTSHDLRTCASILPHRAVLWLCFATPTPTYLRLTCLGGEPSPCPWPTLVEAFICTRHLLDLGDMSEWPASTGFACRSVSSARLMDCRIRQDEARCIADDHLIYSTSFGHVAGYRGIRCLWAARVDFWYSMRSPSYFGGELQPH